MDNISQPSLRNMLTKTEMATLEVIMSTAVHAVAVTTSSTSPGFFVWSLSEATGFERDIWGFIHTV